MIKMSYSQFDDSSIYIGILILYYINKIYMIYIYILYTYIREDIYLYNIFISLNYMSQILLWPRHRAGSPWARCRVGRRRRGSGTWPPRSASHRGFRLKDTAVPAVGAVQHLETEAFGSRNSGFHLKIAGKRWIFLQKDMQLVSFQVKVSIFGAVFPSPVRREA